MKKIIILSLALLCSGHAIAGERISIIGSTTVLPVLSQAAQLYSKQHPDLTITVSGGGSGVGIASVIQGTAQIGMASRDTTADEEKKLQHVDNIVIAADAVAMAVSKQVYMSGIHQLSLSQIADIYRGNIRNWQELGGLDARIVVIDKEAGRGTRHVFAKAVLGNKHARAAGATLISGSNNEEQGIIARSHQAIGMLSNAWLTDDVRGIDIVVRGKAIAPNMKNVRNRSYPLARSLRVLVPQSASQATHDFVKFLLTKPVQDIVQRVGYLPVL